MNRICLRMADSNLQIVFDKCCFLVHALEHRLWIGDLCACFCLSTSES